MSETGFQPPVIGHPDGRARPWLAPLLAVGIIVPLAVAVALFGPLLGVLAWLGLAVVVGVVWGGWSYVQEGWDRLRARWVR